MRVFSYSILISCTILSSISFANENPTHFRHPIKEVSGDQFPRSIDEFHTKFGDGHSVEEPIIFKGTAKNWEIMKCISDDKLDRNYGNSLVSIFSNWNEDEESIGSQSVVMPLSKYIEISREAKQNSHYLIHRCIRGDNATVNSFQCKLSDEKKEDEKSRKKLTIELSHICSDLEKKSEFPMESASWDSKTQKPFILWFFGGYSKTMFHNHMANFLTQLRGKKKAYIINPNEAHFLNCPVTKERTGCLSTVDPENPDYERHPYFANANVYEVTVEEGDVLFIPTSWFHNVQAIDVPSLSLVYFYPKI